MENEITKEVTSGIAYLTLNRPERLNAFSSRMLTDLAVLLDDCNADDQVCAIVLTGRGKFFTSGNDQKNFLRWIGKETPEREHELDLFVDKVDKLCGSLIKNTKPLIVGVNGPAVGIGMTTLGHADYVIACESSYFWAPFSKIGINPEMCSSYTFPRIVGLGRAKKILLFSQKMTANEALSTGIVSIVISNYATDEIKLSGHSESGSNGFHAKLRQTVNDLICPLSNEGLLFIKRLLDEGEVDKLHEVREKEKELLRISLARPEVEEYAMKILAKK